MEAEEDVARKFLEEGISAARAGHPLEARRLLTRVIQEAPTHRLAARAWLWLSATYTDPDDRRECLEHALAIDPTDPAAQRGLALLSGKARPAPRAHPESGDEVERYWGHPEQQAAPTEGRPVPRPVECWGCGGQMVYSPKASALVCTFCGRTRVPREPRGQAEAPLFALHLPLAAAHQVTMTERVLTCTECGAQATMPAGTLTTECPFCATPYVLEAAKPQVVVRPHGVIPFRIPQEKARQRLHAWLGRGWFRPDDLLRRTRAEDPRGVYLPFWLFDGLGSTETLSLGSGGELPAMLPQGFEPSGVARDREEEALPYTRFYNDIPVPAGAALPRALAAQLQYDTQGIVPYALEYVAGWPAELPHQSLADASLEARETIAQHVRRAGLTQQAVHVALETYRLVLMPVWLTGYTYRGARHLVAVNGQTGQVVGEAPLDKVKVVLWGAIVALLLVLALILLRACAGRPAG